jgi:hypothetical protein
MPSPFPGMNPYLEQPAFWKDFHQTYVPALRDALVGPLAARGYTVRVEETLLDKEPVERFASLKIRNRNDDRIVTVLELLSPSNKQPGLDRASYLRKRRSILNSSANLVELDLLRDGPRMPLREVPICDYLLLISRVEVRPAVDLWPVGLRQPLPVLPVPLHAGEAPVPLDLQEVLHTVYERAGYAYTLENSELDPPLREADAAWAKGLLAEDR